MKRTMRVAFISYDFGEYSIQHATALARRGEVLLVLPRQLAEPHLDKLDPAVHFLPFDRPRLRQPLKQAARLRTILRAVHRFRPDVIHLQCGHLWFNLTLPLLRRYPLVLTIHDPRPHLGDRGSQKTPEAIRELAYRRADRVIAHAQPVKDAIVEHLGIAAEKVHVVPHVAIGERRSRETIAEEDGLVLFFGRIWEYKGLDYLIRAEPLVTAEASQARFLIAGEGEDFARYERLMVHPERFEVHNRWISDDECAAMFRRASVVVLPYVEATQSGVVPVAYSHGKPVVATRTGGLPEVVDHGRTGLLVPPRDEAALAEAVIALLRDAPRRCAMGQAGREKLEAECSPDAVVAKTLPVYEAAIRDFHARRSRNAARRSNHSREEESGLASESIADACHAAALRLHEYLAHRHLRADGLAGPDVGIRINYRVGRFVKGYLPFIPWRDALYYVQGQAYWALANWRLYDLTGETRYQDHAVACMRGVMARQRADGAWEYPNREWKGRIATAEGNWGALALSETYRQTGAGEFLESMLRWHEYLLTRTGFQRVGDELAVNYFAAPDTERVCNNSAFTLRLFAELADVTGDARYLEQCPGMVRFLARAQLPGGELPYTVPGEGGGPGRPHFQCCQYNAFQCLDLIRYWELTGDAAAFDIVAGQMNFLRASQADDGHAFYQCGHRSRQVTYHAAVLAATLAKASEIGLSGHEAAAERSYRYVLALQREDGGFPHSRREHGVLADHRSYPRNLAMILFHLLHARPTPPTRRADAGLCSLETHRS